MPFDQERRNVAFQKLDRQLSKLAKKPAPNSIHKFRTYSRRVEAFIDQLVPDPTHNDRKLLKRLGRIRKKAGEVRDLDVQISALRSLKIPQDAARKSQLLTRLVEDREKREQKLSNSFDKASIRKLRQRLQRALQGDGVPAAADPLKIAMQQFVALRRDHAPLTEKRLHQYRIVGKRARYLGEFAGKNPEAEQFVAKLKRMQDAIGDWHDWLKLAQRAEEVFGDIRESALLSLLRNVTRAKFNHAVAILNDTQSTLAKKETDVPVRQGPMIVPLAQAGVAVA